ncbi:VasL domain-containing protein [Klebsiella aerogenes]|uniref:VasL domain-containing protein n=1 Tax=Klebsiella aerogenes TaxID=548 RepID=UPI00403DE998
MTTYPERRLTIGGDPRTMADYAKLREEMHKLSHPARPDIDWLYAERLCLSLFDRNGVELQTAAWYTLARTQLSSQWRQQNVAAALSAENLTGWYQGMLQLQQLTQRLDALDEQKGKYLTVSELKSAVFAITQSLNRTVPVEEQLRQLSAMTEGQISRAAQQQQAEQHLQQLIVSYALLKSKTAE